MQHAADFIEPHLLLPGGGARSRADADENFLRALVSSHVRLRIPLGKGQNRNPAGFTHVHLFIEGQNKRVNLIGSHIHHPFFHIGALQTRDGAVILNTQQNPPALKIHQGHDFFGQLLRANIVALELNAGVFAVGDDFKQFCLQHGLPN